MILKEQADYVNLMRLDKKGLLSFCTVNCKYKIDDILKIFNHIETQ